ncbi:hypothetical protein [Xanthomonas maliensis]|nr:hypothetical protein [Xanthomonas maliensis]
MAGSQRIWLNQLEKILFNLCGIRANRDESSLSGPLAIGKTLPTFSQFGVRFCSVSCRNLEIPRYLADAARSRATASLGRFASRGCPR